MYWESIPDGKTEGVCRYHGNHADDFEIDGDEFRHRQSGDHTCNATTGEIKPATSPVEPGPWFTRRIERRVSKGTWTGLYVRL